MPGLTGIIYKPGSGDYEWEHSSMVAAMHHEPFYAKGSYAEPRLNLRVGWALHSSQFLPLVNNQRDLALFFYGEDFSQHRSELKTEIGPHALNEMLSLYEERGDSFLSELNGWFTGLLVDSRQRKVLLFNDRYGMQRLYYRETEDAFFFASEAKSLLRVLGSSCELNMDAFAEYAAFDFVLEEKSLFKNVSLLPGGSCWTFDETGRSKRRQYYSPVTLESKAPAKENPVDHLQELLSQVFPRYCEPLDEVAFSLTGGLDTRLIIAGAKSSTRLASYTFAGDRDTFDVRQSQRVANAMGMRHEVIRLGRDFFKAFPKLAEETVYISDGTLGVSGTHNLYLNRLARKIAPIRLTGLFGSEVLRQRGILQSAAPLRGLLNADFASEVERAEGRGAALRQGNLLTLALHRDIPWRAHGSMSIEQSQITLRSPFMDNRVVDFLYGVPNGLRESNRLQQELIQRLNAGIGAIMTDRGDATDRNPLVVGAARLFLWTLFKADYYYFFDMPDWFLGVERAMKQLKADRLIFGRQKFENYRLWFREDLSEFVADILLDARTLQRPFFNGSFLRGAVEAHIAGKKNYCNELGSALTFELIMRGLVESRAPQHGSPAPVTTVNVH